MQQREREGDVREDGEVVKAEENEDDGKGKDRIHRRTGAVLAAG